MEKGHARYEFSAEKNQQLIKERGISFEEVIMALGSGKLLDIISHHNTSKYPKQKIYLLDLGGYIYVVPFIKKDKQTVFLKTIFPSRKLTKKHLTPGVIS